MYKYLLILIPFMVASCEMATNAEAGNPEPTISFDENPWPEIRKKRINDLLPDALRETGVDAWMIVCRENNNDPLADHIGGEMQEEQPRSCSINPMEKLDPSYSLRRERQPR